MSTSWFKKLRSDEAKLRREGLEELIRSDHPRRRDVLEHVGRTDPDPSLRKLAQAALERLPGAGSAWDVGAAPRANQAASARSSPETATDQESAGPTVQSPESPPPSPAEDTPEWTEARAALNRAISLYSANKRAQAGEALRRALRMYPWLAREAAARNLAAELSGRSDQGALRAFISGREVPLAATDASNKEAAPGLDLGGWFRLGLLGAALALLAGVSIWFVRTGYAARYAQLLRLASYAGDRQVFSGTEYYLVVPPGEPPQGGWPMVVALHGYGGSGRDMLSLAQTFTERGVVFLAPTFGEYRPNPGIGPIREMHGILEQASESTPIRSGGVVFYGFSQGGTFAFRFSAFHPEWVSAVVADGAPELDPLPPPSHSMPYYLAWGENDGLQDFLLPIVFELQRRNYNVSAVIVEGAGHEVTEYSIHQVLGLLGR
ncbi:MAG: hypothetical protein R3191_06660 [Anaerolineales bacterium]|nr:hypothetical protein [Anaerolineales bacterium]